MARCRAVVDLDSSCPGDSRMHAVRRCPTCTSRHFPTIVIIHSSSEAPSARARLLKSRGHLVGTSVQREAPHDLGRDLVVWEIVLQPPHPPAVERLCRDCAVTALLQGPPSSSCRGFGGPRLAKGAASQRCRRRSRRIAGVAGPIGLAPPPGSAPRHTQNRVASPKLSRARQVRVSSRPQAAACR